MAHAMAVRQWLNTFLLAFLVMGIVASTAGAQDEHEHDDIDEEVVTFFQEYISGPIVQTRCIYCHVEGGRSAHTRLVFVRAADTDHHEEHNLM